MKMKVTVMIAWGYFIISWIMPLSSFAGGVPEAIEGGAKTKELFSQTCKDLKTQMTETIDAMKSYNTAEFCKRKENPDWDARKLMDVDTKYSRCLPPGSEDVIYPLERIDKSSDPPSKGGAIKIEGELALSLRFFETYSKLLREDTKLRLNSAASAFWTDVLKSYHRTFVAGADYDWTKCPYFFGDKSEAGRCAWYLKENLKPTFKQIIKDIDCDREYSTYEDTDNLFWVAFQFDTTRYSCPAADSSTDGFEVQTTEGRYKVQDEAGSVIGFYKPGSSAPFKITYYEHKDGLEFTYQSSSGSSASTQAEIAAILLDKERDLFQERQFPDIDRTDGGKDLPYNLVDLPNSKTCCSSGCELLILEKNKVPVDRDPQTDRDSSLTPDSSKTRECAPSEPVMQPRTQGH